MLGVRGGVMRQTCQRVIHALRGKRRKCRSTVGGGLGQTVHDVIVSGVQIRNIKYIAQGEIRRPFLRHRHVGIGRDGEMHGDRRIRQADLHRHAVVFHQKLDLLFQIVPEQIRARHRRRMHTGLRYVTKAETAVDAGKGRRRDADFGIIGAVPDTGMAVYHRLGKGLDQITDARLIQLDQPIHRRLGIVEQLGRCDIRRFNL